MKFFGHPLHVMVIHFPVGLLPAELVLSFLAYSQGAASFLSAAFYCLAGGVAMGYIALITGLLDLRRIPKEDKIAIGTGLIHGFINGLVILVYSILLYKAWQESPRLNPPSPALLLVKLLLVSSLFVGNFLGGKLIYIHHIGINNKL